MKSLCSTFSLAAFFFFALYLCSRAQTSDAAPNRSDPLTKNFPVSERRVIHAFVALCDNASQGIQPVPPKIGNGDDPPNNLYWGCDDGLRSFISKSKDWKRVAVLTPLPDQKLILERLVFQHTKTKTWLIADAYKGSEIKQAIKDYFAALAGTLTADVEVAGATIHAGGKANLIAYIGHDGLMEFDVDVPKPVGDRSAVRAIALCCISQKFFGPKITASGATPYLLTTQLMYPGSFLLHAAAESWLEGGTPEQALHAAARAYAKNQNISIKGAAGVFTVK